MWGYTCPKLKNAEEDVDIFIKLGIIQSKEKDKYLKVVRNYDTNKADSDKSLYSDISAADCTKIYNNYENTYETKKLFFIRKELRSLNEEVCPYCGHNSATTLDHFLNKSDYHSLALCRLNLVPLCPTCNTRKNDSNGKDYIHPYYTEFPDVEFFNCKFRKIEDELDFYFYITNISDDKLKKQLENQISTIKLKDTLLSPVKEFLRTDIYNNCSKDELNAKIKSLLNQNIKNFRKNHWKPTILRGLIDFFNESEQNIDFFIDNMKKRNESYSGV